MGLRLGCGNRRSSTETSVRRPRNAPPSALPSVGNWIRDSDHVLADVGPQDFGNVDPAVGPLVVLQDHDQGPAESATAVPLSVWTNRVPFWPAGR